MKQITFLILFLFTLSAFSQNFEDQWSGFFSYVSVKSISQGDDKIYAASENSVFTYDLSTQELNTITTINGLSGEIISTIYYSEEYNLLVIGYENGLIDVMLNGDEDILRVVDIFEKPTIPPDKKRINHFNEYNGNLYISSQFGISLFNLATLEFGDTYFIGDLGSQLNITQTTVLEPYIFASTMGGGVRVAMVEDDNLIDYEQWTAIATGNYIGIQTLSDEVYGITSTSSLYQFNPQGIEAILGNVGASVKSFVSNNDLLTITTETESKTYSVGYQLVASVSNIPDFEYNLQFGYVFENNFYLGTSSYGILVVPFENNNVTQLLPDGPILNEPFSIDATPGQLWAVFGDITVSFNPFPLSRRGVSNLKEGEWTNLPFDDIFDANDLVNVSINPNDTEQVYMSSYLKGLLKITGQVPEILYNETNSPLEIGNDNPDVGIRIYGSDFDSQGNLWFVQSNVEKGLNKLTPGGQIQQIDLTDIIDAEDEIALTVLKVSREGYVFFGSASNGVIGYNPSNGLFNKIGEDIGNGNLSSHNVRALEFDKQNRLWIGSLEGIRVLYNVGGFFEENADNDTQPIIFLDDGVAQELLFKQPITDIEVDGSNNKWIATATSGVFYVSPNGQETLLRFTKENSPLPSNIVQDIAIDAFTGVVYFATKNGLVAYNGTATAPRENLENVYAFPNPVRPTFKGNVTIDGLTANANVKITDIEGNLVFEETSEGGSVLWDTTAFGRYKVSSGVYLVLITTDDALETKVTKVMIIR